MRTTLQLARSAMIVSTGCFESPSCESKDPVDDHRPRFAKDGYPIRGTASGRFKDGIRFRGDLIGQKGSHASWELNITLCLSANRLAPRCPTPLHVPAQTPNDGSASALREDGGRVPGCHAMLGSLGSGCSAGERDGFQPRDPCRWAVHPRQQLDATYRTALGLFRLIFCVFPIDPWSHQTRRLKWLVVL
jgi:hypothetical protein